ncbi:hypothetical protein SD235_04885 [Burkholderia cepacia]|uniref:hypothetical protein n=1 Tax=Burkholderia cepacia TaxID=292 RepID=UPI003A4E11F2
MATFTTRVVLHDVADNSADYEKLHDAMGEQGFSRMIESDDERLYKLPPAEYNIEGSLTRKDVLSKAKVAARRTGREFSVLVTESLGRRWYNLEEIEVLSDAD